MFLTTDITNALAAEDIIPDILPIGTTIRRNLKVAFPTVKVDRPGKMINVDNVQSKPSVFVDLPIEEDILRDIYTLIVVDPDLTRRHDTRFGQVRHWLVTKYSVSSAGEVIDSRARTLSPWIAPAPIPVHHIAGKPHPSRYTFILCKSKPNETMMSSTLDLDENTPGSNQHDGLASELGNASQDIFDRCKFNAQRFIQKNNLEVVAATFMLVEGNVTSGVKNVGLMANAAGNKIGI